MQDTFSFHPAAVPKIPFGTVTGITRYIYGLQGGEL